MPTEFRSGPDPDFLLGEPHVRSRRVQTLHREAVRWSSCAILGRQTCCGPVTATTDFLAPDILNRCGRAIPAVPQALPKDPDDRLRRDAARRFGPRTEPQPCR